MSKFNFRDYELDITKCELLKSSVKVELEPQVYCLIELLVKNHDKIISRDEIIEHVWDGRYISNNLIDNRIKSARAALGDNGRKQRFIKTYPNRGYKFVANVVNVCPIALEAMKADQTSKQAAESEKSLLLKRAVGACVFAAIIFMGFLTWQISGKLNENESRPQSATSIAAQGEAAAPETEAETITLAVLPISKENIVGDMTAHPYLPDILNSELMQTVMAIDGLSVISILDASMTPTQSATSTANIIRTDWIQNLGIDYFIKMNVTSYGKEVKFLVQLIHAKDNVVLASRGYVFDETGNADLAKWPSENAMNATISFANELGLPVNEYSPYITSYAFQEKIERARQLLTEDDLDVMDQAIALLKEAVVDEPDYLPAHSLMYFAYWRRLNFSGTDVEKTVLTMMDLANEMARISPNSPEAAVAYVISGGVGTQGVLAPAQTKDYEYKQLEVLRKSAEAIPQNATVQSIYAYRLSLGSLPSDEDVRKAYRTALRYNPTNSYVLGDYAWSQFCRGNIKTAQDLVDQNQIWNPNHRWALSKQARIAFELGDYDTALTAIKTIIDKGGRVQSEVEEAYQLAYYTFGNPEDYISYLQYPPVRAQAYALMGDYDAARSEMEKRKASYINQNTKLTLDPNYIPKDYFPDRNYGSLVKGNDTAKALSCALHTLAQDTYNLKLENSDRYPLFLKTLEDYYADRNIDTFETAEDYVGFMALHILEGKQDQALAIMDAAMDNGFVFLGRFKQPLLRQLLPHPGFAARYERMQARGAEIQNRFKSKSRS